MSVYVYHNDVLELIKVVSVFVIGADVVAADADAVVVVAGMNIHGCGSLVVVGVVVVTVPMLEVGWLIVSIHNHIYSLKIIRPFNISVLRCGSAHGERGGL